MARANTEQRKRAMRNVSRITDELCAGAYDGRQLPQPEVPQMVLTTASSPRKETSNHDQLNPVPRGGRIAAFDLYRKIVESPPTPAQFRRYTALRYKLSEIDSYFIGDIFRVSGLKDLLEDMGALRKQVTATPNDYLKKCFALRWAEYLQLIQQYDNEVPLKWATDHGTLVLQHLIEVQDATQEALYLWCEVASNAETTVVDGKVNA